MASDRFTVTVDEDWSVRVSRADDESWQRERTLRRLDTAAGAFPLPPDDDPPAADAPHHALCAGDEAALTGCLQRLEGRQPEAGDIGAFGGYLFHTLLGPDVWADVLRRAGEDRLVELALEWDAQDAQLHRLGWEMMRAPEGFLAAGRPRPVAVTRVVRSAVAAPSTAGYPARVLFLVGSDLNDPRVRSGAEFLALLRRVELEGRSFHSRVVQRATPAEAARAVRSFRPDVVHVIGHGDLDRDGRPFLDFHADPGESGSTAGRVTGERLLHVLDGEGEADLPGVVVLSACYSAGAAVGRAMGGAAAAPLAATLVSGGVPVVVGMGGRIADRACRHFTRRFGQALVTGEPLVEAVELGRRAVFAEEVEPARSVDWSLPAVFIAPTVPPDHVPSPAPPEAVAAADMVRDRIAAYEPKRVPVFCARQDFQEAYYGLMERPTRPVIAIYARPDPPRIGTSRLLDEIIGQAIRDDHVPVLVRKRSEDEHMHFDCAARLGVGILGGIGLARRAFDLAPPVDAAVLRLLRAVDPNGHRQVVDTFGAISDATVFTQLLRHYEQAESEPLGLLDGSAVRDAVRADLRTLAEDVRQTRDSGDEDCRVLVLFDDVHEYDRGIDALINELLGPHGLGEPGRPVPVVLAFRLGTAADSVLQSLTLHQQTKPWLEARPLKPFRNDGEDLLAYARVLLHPFDERLLPGVSDTPLAMRADYDPVVVKLAQNTFRIVARGRPAAFFEEGFWAAAQAGLEAGFLVPADDEERLQALLKDCGP